MRPEDTWKGDVRPLPGAVVSENGPREGTRDLPRRHPDSGRRAVDPTSVAGVAYGKLSKSLRRRRAELVDLLRAGGSPTDLARSYESDHPLEPPVTSYEVEQALTEARVRSPRRPG